MRLKSSVSERSVSERSVGNESDWNVNDFDILRYNYFKIRKSLRAEIILTHNFTHKLYNYMNGIFGVTSKILQ